MGLCLFSRVAITNYHKLCGLEQQNCIPSQFWGRKSEVKVWEGHVSSEGSREESFLASSQLLGIPINPQRSLACSTSLQSLPLSWHGSSPSVSPVYLCVSVFKFCLFFWGHQPLDWKPTVTSSELYYICKDSISRQDHIDRYQRLAFQHLLEGHSSTHNNGIIETFCNL